MVEMYVLCIGPKSDTFFNRRYHLDEHVKDSFYVVGIFPSCKEGCSHYSLLQKLINNFLFGISPFLSGMQLMLCLWFELIKSGVLV